MNNIKVALLLCLLMMNAFWIIHAKYWMYIIFYWIKDLICSQCLICTKHFNNNSIFFIFTRLLVKYFATNPLLLLFVSISQMLWCWIEKYGMSYTFLIKSYKGCKEIGNNVIKIYQNSFVSNMFIKEEENHTHLCHISICIPFLKDDHDHKYNHKLSI